VAVDEGGIVLCEQKQMQEVIDAMFERKVNIFLFQFICFGNESVEQQRDCTLRSK